MYTTWFAIVFFIINLIGTHISQFTAVTNHVIAGHSTYIIYIFLLLLSLLNSEFEFEF